MPVYLLTNKVTHARAVVIAESADEARAVHPTNGCAHRRWGRWARYRGGPMSETRETVPPPEGWPRDLSLIHADEIAPCVARQWEGCAQPLCYEPSTDLRRGAPNQEGPDATWGGYLLERLTEVLDADD